jgi:hypothetical protein
VTRVVGVFVAFFRAPLQLGKTVIIKYGGGRVFKKQEIQPL